MEGKMPLFDKCCADIDEEYVRLGHTIGWRFLSGPKDTLKPFAEVAFITLNPGGTFDPPGHPRESQEAGSAYRVESWNGMPPGQSKLQVQVCTMFELLAKRLGGIDHRGLMDETLVGHFIPFRSPDYESLQSKTDSLAFAVRLWGGIFDYIAPKTVITMDRLTFKHVRKMVKDRHSNLIETHIQIPTGWGEYKADIVRFSSAGDGVTLIRLPHLSRFGIFTSNRCRQAVSRIVDSLVDGLQASPRGRIGSQSSKSMRNLNIAGRAIDTAATSMF
jgi:hypothetical protein